MNPSTFKAEDRSERIRKRAYELYLQRGATSGKALDDWLTAEREVEGAGTAPKSPSRPAPPVKPEPPPALERTGKPAAQGFASKLKESFGRG